MPYQLENPSQGVIIAHLSGDLSIEEIAELNQDIVSHYFKDNQDFYLIYEVSELHKFPMEIQRLRKASEPIASFKGVKCQVVTGVKSPIFNFLFDMIGQLFRQQLKKTHTLQEALQFVDTLREKH